MTATMRLELGSPIHCTDGVFGELADVVVDPVSHRVTHLVVQPEGGHERARLVPIDLARPQGTPDAAITLACTITEVAALDPIHEAAYLRLGEAPVEDPDWDVGVEEVFALPYFEAADGFIAEPIDADAHAVWHYDRIPKGEVEIRRASAVSSADGHHLGHVDGFVVDAHQQISHVVLERGHLWGKREVLIPINAVAGVESDAITLTLSKDEVGALPSHGVRRRR